MRLAQFPALINWQNAVPLEDYPRDFLALKAVDSVMLILVSSSFCIHRSIHANAAVITFFARPENCAKRMKL